MAFNDVFIFWYIAEIVYSLFTNLHLFPQFPFLRISKQDIRCMDNLAEIFRKYTFENIGKTGCQSGPTSLGWADVATNVLTNLKLQVLMAMHEIYCLSLRCTHLRCMYKYRHGIFGHGLDIR